MLFVFKIKFPGTIEQFATDNTVAIAAGGRKIGKSYQFGSN
jgi:hypothetical protein